MHVPMEIIATIIAFMLANLGAVIGFAWKYNQNYRDDKETQTAFLNTIRSEFMNRLNTLEQERVVDQKNSALCRAERTAETNKQINNIAHELHMVKEMSNRDIKELNEKIDDITSKMDTVQDSIVGIHERIDELFKAMSKKVVTKTIKKQPSKTPARQ